LPVIYSFYGNWFFFYHCHFLCVRFQDLILSFFFFLRICHINFVKGEQRLLFICKHLSRGLVKNFFLFQFFLVTMRIIIKTLLHNYLRFLFFILEDTIFFFFFFFWEGTIFFLFWRTEFIF
jgi:hypothetical protein